MQTGYFTSRKRGTGLVALAWALQSGHLRMVIAAPGLPPLLQNPLPKGLLLGGTPLAKR